MSVVTTNRGARGFTLIEMLVVVTIVGILALAARPVVELSVRRAKEAELRAALRELRGAIDGYKAAFDAGRVAPDRSVGDSGYPPSLDVLVDGVAEVAGVTLPGGPSGSAAAASSAASAPTSPVALAPPTANAAAHRLYLLRRLPRDPFADPSLPAAATWATRSYASPPDAPQPGADVFDVLPTATGSGLDGTPYRQW